MFGMIALVGCGASGEAVDAPALDVGVGVDVDVGLEDGDGGGADTSVADTATATDATTSVDGGVPDGSLGDASADASLADGLADGLADTGGALADSSSATDSALADSVVADVRPADAGADTGADSGGVDAGVPAGPITGGPCSSGATGATAFRLRWAGSGSGSTAYVVYEVEGLPDNGSLKAGAYGYSTSYKPTFDDPFLGVGGLVLDSSSFVDVDFSTVGITSIKRATVSIKGRSFNTTASGSYNWQTFDGAGATPSGAVANSAPYAWYGPLSFLGSSGPIGDATAVIKPGKTIKLRLKAGPPSGSLIVNLIELCLEAT
jgi:hypothetical protein